MTRIIATVSTVAALLLAPAPALVASPPAFDLGDLPIVGPIVGGLLGDDDPVDPTPEPSAPVTPAPTVSASPSPVEPAPSASPTPGGGASAPGGTGASSSTGAAPPAVASSPVSGSVASSAAPSTGRAPAVSSSGEGPLLQPEDGTTLTFTPGPLDPSTLASSSVSPTPSPGLEGGLLLLGGMGLFVLIAVVVSRMWRRSAPR